MPIIKPTLLQRVFCYQVDKDGGFFRIFGVGLSWKRLEERPLLFSERNGHVPFLVVRGWMIRPVPRWKF